MKRIIQIFLICLLVFCGNAFAQNDISGTWEGRLEVAPGQEMTVRFIITKQGDGSYKAVLDSPDTGAIKNESASAVTYAGNKLTVEVDSLSGSYSGTVSKDTITGEWKQPGGTLPLVLTAYKKPSPSAFKPLLGEWHGKLRVPGGDSLTTVFQFAMTEDGRISASLQIVEQNQQNVPVNNVLLKDNKVSFDVAGQLNYEGRLSGNTIEGAAKQGTMEMELNLTKGKYVDPGIEMSAENIKKLAGQWVGRLNVDEETTITVVLNFEATGDGKLKASTNSPEQGSKSIPVTDVVLTGDRLNFKVPAAQGVFTGSLNNNSMTGSYNAGGKNNEIALTRGGRIEPPVSRVDIPAETMKQLLGRWSGAIGQLKMIFRFERDASGKNAIFVDVPQQGAENIPVLNASLADGKLTLKVAGAKYSGTLEGVKINGTWNQNNQTIPLVLSKE